MLAILFSPQSGGFARICTQARAQVGMGEGVEEPNARISFHSVFPSLRPFLRAYKSTQAKSVKDACVEGNLEMPARRCSPEPEDLPYLLLHPPHSQARLLPLLLPLRARAPSLSRSDARARAWEPNAAFLRLGARGRLLPSRPSHPRSKGQSALPR